MPILSPIVILNIAIFATFLAIILVALDRALEVYFERRIIFSGEPSASYVLRTCTFLATALILIVMGFFSWETFIVSDRERNLINAEADFRNSVSILSNERNRISELPIAVEQAREEIRRLNRRISLLVQNESEFLEASGKAALENFEASSTSSVPNLTIAEAERDAKLADVNSVAAIEFQSAKLDLDAKIDQLKMSIAQQADGDDSSADNINGLREALSELEALSPKLFDNIREQRIKQIEDDFLTVVDEVDSREQVKIRVRRDALAQRKAELVAEVDTMRSEVLELETSLAVNVSRLENADSYISSLQERVESHRESIDRVAQQIEKAPLRQSSADTALAFRALALGALGAMVTLLISHERDGQRRARTLFLDRDFFSIFISQMIRGCVVAVAGYALIFTDILSFQNSPIGEPEEIPDFWKMTLVCIALGAFSERIYDAVGARIPSTDDGVGDATSNRSLDKGPS